jgi:hypothetical protein
MKTSAAARNAIPAEPNASRESGLKCHASAAKRSATTVGIVDWKTIAPVMFPIARVSLPWRTQITELNFSGSSVAIGAMTSARIVGAMPNEVDRCWTASTKKKAPRTMNPSAVSTWRLTTRRRGTVSGAFGVAGSRRLNRSGARS